jgi:hypothetical protein
MGVRLLTISRSGNQTGGKYQTVDNAGENQQTLPIWPHHFQVTLKDKIRISEINFSKRSYDRITESIQIRSTCSVKTMPRAFDPSKITMARQGHHAARSTVNNMGSSVTKAQARSTEKIRRPRFKDPLLIIVRASIQWNGAKLDMQSWFWKVLLIISDNSWHYFIVSWLVRGVTQNITRFADRQRTLFDSARPSALWVCVAPRMELGNKNQSAWREAMYPESNRKKIDLHISLDRPMRVPMFPALSIFPILHVTLVSHSESINFIY